ARIAALETERHQRGVVRMGGIALYGLSHDSSPVEVGKYVVLERFSDGLSATTIRLLNSGINRARWNIFFKAAGNFAIYC
ncbi:hypothetical protein, partial [Neisseria dentiae]|uniref:hypothetical protein n=1 Tax=Neisseria dentiae TaxID=194197 RepID=UPI0035A09279